MREIAILPQFFAIELHFVRKACARTACGKSQFFYSFWRSNLISCERVATGCEKSQFYYSFWRSNLISCEKVATGCEKSQFYYSFSRLNLMSREFFKGLRPDPRNRNFTALLAIESISCERVTFRAVSLALPRAFKRKIEQDEAHEPECSHVC